MVPGSYPDCYAREGLVLLLKKAQDYLPDDLVLKIYDGYRHICIQQRLWNLYHTKIKNEFPNLSDEEIDFKTSFFAITVISFGLISPEIQQSI